MSQTSSGLKLPTSKLVFVDIEGHGTDIRWDKTKAVYFTGLLIVDENRKNTIVRYREIEKAIVHIEELLADGYSVWIFNARFDYGVLKTHRLKHTIEPGKLTIGCTQVLAYTRESNLDSYSLDALTGMKADVVQQCVDLGLIEPQPKKTFWSTDWSNNEAVRQVIDDYCVQDLKATHSLYKRLAAWYNQPDNECFIQSLLDLEFPMLEVLVELETNGAYVHPERLSSLSYELSLDLSTATDTLNKTVGLLPRLQWNEEANEYQPTEKTYAKGSYTNKKTNVAHYMGDGGVVLSSSPYIVYDHCKLIPYNAAAATGHNWWLLKHLVEGDVLEKAGKTKKGKPQLNKDYFKDIADELPDSLPIARVLKLTKALQKTTELTYHLKHDGRIHCSFNNCLTRTGRLSSSDTNLQNIPRPEGEGSIGSKFRQLFSAAPGNVILGADLDRIEIVVLAWYLSTVCKDSSLLDICNIPDSDVHQANADRWGVSRSVAKTLIFLLVYGGGASLIFRRGMAPTLADAEAMVCQVAESQPAIQKLKELVWARAAKRGYIKNTFNCRGVYPELNSKQKWVKAGGERMAFNYLIQRTARDIMHTLLVESLPAIRFCDAKLTLVVHDEAIVECPEEKAEDLKAVLNGIWNNRYNILPGIKVNGDWNIGESWYAVK